MDNHNQQAPDPEKFWPEAEKMLDKHFKLQRRKKIFALAFIAGLLFIGTTYLLVSEKTSFKTTEKSVETQTMASSTEAHEPKANTKSQSNKSVENLGRNRNNPKENATSEIKKDSEIKVKERHKAHTETSVLANSKTGKLTDDKLNLISNQVNTPHINPSGNLWKESEKMKENTGSFESHIQEKSTNASSVTYHSLLEEGVLSSTVPFIASIKPIKFPQQENEAQLKAPFKLNSDLKKTNTKGLSIGMYFTLQNVSKNIQAEENPEYIERRSTEEKSITSPGIGIVVSRSWNNLSYGIGLEYSYLGEKTTYDAYSRQTQYTQTGSWQTYTHLVTDIDTVYVSGLQWFLETQVSRVDSTYETRVDSILINKYDPSISDRNSINKIQYMEVPLLLTYSFPLHKFKIGISGGISPVFILSQRGHYLKQDLSGVESIEDKKPFNAFLLNGRLGLDISYLLNPRVRIFCNPHWKTNITDITKSKESYSQNYTVWGFQFGAAYNLY
ncbi:MAG: hypothetical protein EYC69_07085 [Bacteroidetes bacterium]|nr:MAG: hypothetical protein EYC69_07085 [Bacteroidota bacterium]